MIKVPVYLDAPATTPLDPEVKELMQVAMEQVFGNPASSHCFGREAKAIVDQARAEVAALIHASEEEIIFTSGTTESNNLALKGLAEIMLRRDKRHILSQPTEHKAVLEPLEYLQRKGFEVEFVKVDATGQVAPEAIRERIRDDTFLISIMHANNELGTIQPIREIGAIAKEQGIFFHVDAAQSAGKIPIDVEADGIDLLSFSAHKMYGPKGIGALYVRKKRPYVRLEPILHGGGHEQGLRAGTLNVPAIAGFGKACMLALKEMPMESERLRNWRDALYRYLCNEAGDIVLNGHPVDRLPHHLHITIKGVMAESLLSKLDSEIAFSTGSACTTGMPEPSHVLKAIGLPEQSIHSSIRLGLHRFLEKEQVDWAAKRLVETIRELRAIGDIFESA